MKTNASFKKYSKKQTNYSINDAVNQVKSMRRHQLIDKLVSTWHLNVPERSQLSPQSVSLEEISIAIQKALSDCRFFPSIARPASDGEAVVDPIFEGYFIEKADKGYVVHVQASGPHPMLFRGRSSKRFSSFERAVKYYVANEYDGEIDGIPITA